MNIRENQMNRTTPRIRIQAHILTVIKKITSLLEYRGIMENKKSILMIKKTARNTRGQNTMKKKKGNKNERMG